MLGKLFKYEFKNTYKLMFIIYGVMAFVTILGCIAMYGDSDPAGTGDLLYSSYGILCTRRICTFRGKLCIYVCTFL